MMRWMAACCPLLRPHAFGSISSVRNRCLLTCPYHWLCEIKAKPSTCKDQALNSTATQWNRTCGVITLDGCNSQTTKQSALTALMMISFSTPMGFVWSGKPHFYSSHFLLSRKRLDKWEGVKEQQHTQFTWHINLLRLVSYFHPILHKDAASTLFIPQGMGCIETI